jgi:prepilin-type processing-associated H-X9-DG protein
MCGTNLKGLGTAMMVYANDYDDEFPIQGGEGTPAWTTGTDEFFNPDKDWSTARGITVGASLYLLVREADVSPKSFVCPESEQTSFDGRNPLNSDITEMWDFGMYTANRVKRRDDGRGNTHGPKNHVSYSYQMPYGPNGGAGDYAADGTKSAAFAVMADKNPWYDPKLRTGTPTAKNCVDYVAAMGAYYENWDLEKWQVQVANAYPHDRQGQNVLFGDGHSAYEKVTDVGVKHDNIYTRRGIGGSEGDIRIGDAGEMARYTVDNAWQPRDDQDSFLVNDDSRLPPYPVP